MKLAEHFADFLETTVNLNQSRLSLLEERSTAIMNFVNQCDWEVEINAFSPIGSWAQGTIIKPLEGNIFDADLQVFVKPKNGFDAKDYINTLAKKFRDSGVYGDKATCYSHCITIEYSGDFRVDVVPCVENRQTNNTKEVCNRNENKFEVTNPLAYNTWILERNTWSGSNGLKKTTRLMKYLRDIKTTFTCSSILLTTLLAYHIRPTDQNTDAFEDVPSSLQTIITRLDEWLQRHETKPQIPNPTLTSEDLSGHWTEEQYTNFRNVIHRYRKWIDEAISEEEYDESIRKWRRVFHDDFAKGEAVNRATEAMKNLAERVQAGCADFVEAVKRRGSQALALVPKVFPHMEVLPHAKDSELLPIRIQAFEKPTKQSNRGRLINSGEPVSANSGIEFNALLTTGLPFSDGYKIKWQVVNTDTAAANNNCLRGGFYESDTHATRWEATTYRGVHWVQAFAINKRTDRVSAHSERFFVVVE